MRTLDARSTNIREIAAAVAHLTRNRSGTVTLTANAASTTVNDPTVTPDSIISLDPLTANAAAALGTTYITMANRLAGSFTITHANNAQNDRTFRWIAAGD